MPSESWDSIELKSRDFPVFFRTCRGGGSLILEVRSRPDGNVKAWLDGIDVTLGEEVFNDFKALEREYRSSYKGLTVDTLAHRGDEGRGYLR